MLGLLLEETILSGSDRPIFEIMGGGADVGESSQNTTIPSLTTPVLSNTALPINTSASSNDDWLTEFVKQMDTTKWVILGAAVIGVFLISK